MFLALIQGWCDGVRYGKRKNGERETEALDKKSQNQVIFLSSLTMSASGDGTF